MRTEKTHLELVFTDASGKSRKINISNPKSELNPVTTRSAMQSIVDAEIFHDEFGDMFAQVDTARYITRTVEPVFTEEA